MGTQIVARSIASLQPCQSVALQLGQLWLAVLFNARRSGGPVAMSRWRSKLHALRSGSRTPARTQNLRIPRNRVRAVSQHAASDSYLRLVHVSIRTPLERGEIQFGSFGRMDLRR